MGGHYFSTRDNESVAKAPEEMFESERMDNDLALVDAAIVDFYGIKGAQSTQKQPEINT
jgi:hypothetical protein